MDTPDSSVPARLPVTGTLRLVLAVSAAGTVMTLCWAALQVRAAKNEARAAGENARQHASAAAPAGLPDLSASHTVLRTKVSDLERQLAEQKSREHQAGEDSAARIAELERVITFLRQENEASHKTIERLSGAERGPAPDPQPMQTNTLNKSRDR